MTKTTGSGGTTGGGRVQVTHNKMRDQAPSWSPDGKKIAYAGFVERSVGNGFYNSRIFTIGVDGGNRFLVT
jgi:Tol biopolymer transport system component